MSDMIFKMDTLIKRLFFNSDCKLEADKQLAFFKQAVLSVISTVHWVNTRGGTRIDFPHSCKQNLY